MGGEGRGDLPLSLGMSQSCSSTGQGTYSLYLRELLQITHKIQKGFILNKAIEQSNQRELDMQKSMTLEVLGLKQEFGKANSRLNKIIFY